MKGVMERCLNTERQVTYFWIIAKAVYMVSKGFFFFADLI